MKFKFNDIANAISVASGVTLAGILAVGTYVFVNKDAIIEDIKEAAIESVMGGMGGSLGTDALPIGTPDLAPPAGQASAKGGGMSLPTPGSPL